MNDEWEVEMPDMSAEARVKIGELGALRRLQMGVTAKNFASETKVPEQFLSEFERGLWPVPDEYLRRIEKGLGFAIGVVNRKLAEVQGGEVHPYKILMDHLDVEDSKNHG